MAITKYFDKKLGFECFKVRVVRKSSVKAGVLVNKSAMGLRTLAEAERAEKKLTTEAFREVFTAEANQSKWKTLILEWYEAVNEGSVFTRLVAKSTIEDYYKALLNHTSEWMNLRVDEIDRSKVWVKLDQIDREMSIDSRKRLRSAMDSVYKWAILSGRIAAQGLPTEGFKTNRTVEERLPEILNLGEIRLLLKTARDVGHEWYPVWALALYTGMRSGELHALRWSSVDFENRMIYVHENWTNRTGFGPTKGRYWRSVPISEHMVVFLKELKLQTEKTGFVLPRFWVWEDGGQAAVLRQFCVGHGLTSIKFHTLRSCFATQLIKDGVAPAIVMKMAGWKDLKTMQRYIRLAGIEVKGATNGLKLLPEEEVMGRVVNLFESEK